MTIYLGLQLPVSSSDYGERGGQPLYAPIPILHRVGFTERTSRHAAGELLPRLSILTRVKRGRFLSVALSLESPPPGITRHLALRCSDFPHPHVSDAVTCLTRNTNIIMLLIFSCIQDAAAVVAFHDAVAVHHTLDDHHGQRHVAPAALVVFHLCHRHGMVALHALIPF